MWTRGYSLIISQNSNSGVEGCQNETVYKTLRASNHVVCEKMTSLQPIYRLIAALLLTVR
jgi:hypothetical protein